MWIEPITKLLILCPICELRHVTLCICICLPHLFIKLVTMPHPNYHVNLHALTKQIYNCINLGNITVETLIPTSVWCVAIARTMCPPANPWSIRSAPTQSLVDCGVGEVCDQAKPFKLGALLWNVTSIVPLRNTENLQFPPIQNVSASNPLIDCMQSLVDCGVGEVCDQADPLKLAAYRPPSKHQKFPISPHRKHVCQQHPGNGRVISYILGNWTKPSAWIIAHGVGMTPRYLVWASSSDMPWYGPKPLDTMVDIKYDSFVPFYSSLP